jgi:hypothetical protein
MEMNIEYVLFFAYLSIISNRRRKNNVELMIGNHLLSISKTPIIKIKISELL